MRVNRDLSQVLSRKQGLWSFHPSDPSEIPHAIALVRSVRHSAKYDRTLPHLLNASAAPSISISGHCGQLRTTLTRRWLPGLNVPHIPRERPWFVPWAEGGASLEGGTGATVCASTTSSREELAGTDTGKEEKEAVARPTRAVEARGAYRGLGCNAREDWKLSKERRVLRSPLLAGGWRYRPAGEFCGRERELYRPAG
jgi:hypothetical protein